MKKKHLSVIWIVGTLILFCLPLLAHAQDEQMGNMPMMQMADKKQMLPHPFFSHEGLPDEPGSYSLRISGLATHEKDMTKGDFAFHLETGLTDFLGLHIRNDRFFDEKRSEAMFQLAALRSKDGMSGFSPFVEFEFPTHAAHISPTIVTKPGFSSKLANSHLAFNQAIHYDPYEDMWESNIAFVCKLGKLFYPVIEVLSEFGQGEKPLTNIVGGLKIRVNKDLLLGFAYQFPVTDRRDFTSQLVFQTDVMW